MSLSPAPWIRRTLLLAALAVCSGLASAEPRIHLRRATIVPDETAPTADPMRLSALARNKDGHDRPPKTTADGRAAYLLQLNRPMDGDMRRTLEALGADRIGHVPDRAWIVLVKPARLDALRQLPFVRWVGEYRAEYKMAEDADPFLALGARAALAVPEETLEVAISTMRPRYVPAVMAAVEQAGGQVVEHGAGSRWGRVRAILPRASIPELATMAEIEWIERHVQPTTMNDTVARDDLLNIARVRTDHGLRGAGQIVAVADTGLDTGDMANLHPDFTNRVHAVFGWVDAADWTDRNGHGTHVAGSVLGSGTAFEAGRFQGMAPQAGLVVQAIGALSGGPNVYPPSPLSLLFAQARDQGARIHSDSWGGAGNGAYTTMAREADEFLWEHDDMLIVFAAGNDGRDANANGIVDAGSVASPGTAKNVLTVGASESDRPAGSGGYSAYTWGIWGAWYPADPIRSDFISTAADGARQGMAAFSGRGPTQDGRIKPDLVAPGTDIVSCRSRVAGAGTGWGTGSGVLEGEPSAHYVFQGGTSMATPLVAGAAALAREYLADRRGLTKPSGPLQKALLINGARSLAPGQYGTNTVQEIPFGPRPNTVEGWGQANVGRSLGLDNGSAPILWDRQLARTAQTNRYAVTVAGTNEWRVTLVWNDFPGSPAAARQLVNDLDLTLILPSGRCLYPNGGNEPDRLNNVLGIDVLEPEPGTNWIEVVGYDVPEEPQTYALVVGGHAEPLPFLALYGVWTTPPAPFDNEQPVVFASVAPGTSEALSVTAAWQINGGTWQFAAMSVCAPGGETDLYRVELPLFEAGAHVRYFVYAVNYETAVISETRELHVGSSTLRVNPDGAPEWPYHRWDNALRHPQDALDLARAGHVVLVTNGVYVGRTLMVDRAVTLLGVNGPDHTVIDGEETRRGMEMTAEAEVRGFLFRRGRASLDGGGVWMSAGVLADSRIADSSAPRYGGGLAMVGGGVAERVRLSGNHAGLYGGGAVVFQAVLRNAVIHDNRADSDAGGVEFWGGAVVNCTIAFNESGEYGGGLDVGATGLLLNNIVVSNTAAVAGDNWYKWVAEEFRYSVTSPNPGGPGCFDADPLFADPTARDFSLQSEFGRYAGDGVWTNDPVTSPCIDMGDPASDWSLEPEPNGGRINIGACGNTPFASKGHDHLRKIVVVSEPGGVMPAPGILYAPTGALFEGSVTEPLRETEPGVQREYRAWRLFGPTDQHGETDGTETNVALNLTDNAVLEWLWHTNYHVSASAVGPGTVLFSNGWYRVGDGISPQAEPDLYYGLASWTGTVQSIANPLPLTVDRPHELFAVFEPLRTAQGTPHYWLAAHGWTNDFETADLADPDGDGMATWAEYIAGTDPTDSNSVLRLRMVPDGDGFLFEWRGKPERFYRLLRTDDLVSGSVRTQFLFQAEFEQDVTVPVPAEDETNAFFWLRVRWP